MSEYVYQEELEAHCRLKGLSDNTVHQYVKAYQRYHDYWNGIINEDTAKTYLGRPRQNTTINRAMMKNLSEATGIKLTIPSLKRSPRKLPRVMKDDELRAVRSVVQEELPHIDLALWLMAECGLRVSETLSVLVKNIDYEQRRIKILGKGNKERYVYLSRALSARISHYCEQARIRKGYLFPSRHEGNKRHMHPNTLRYHIKKVYPEAHPHMLRHRFATKIYEATDGDLATVKELLGHANIATTAIYSHVSPERARQAVQTLHDERD